MRRKYLYKYIQMRHRGKKTKQNNNKTTTTTKNNNTTTHRNYE